MNEIVAVIVDIVGSRRLDDRASAQQTIRDAFATADETVPSAQPLWSTFADEFQAVYADVPTALAATGLVRVLLPEGVDVRFGIGAGESATVEDGDRGEVLDGSAWWRAREAIDEAERRAGRSGAARTWVVTGGDDRGWRAVALLRDQVVDGMKPRERRIAARLLRGETQASIAAAEGVTQSAVSQSARRSGAGTLVQVQNEWLAGAGA